MLFTLRIKSFCCTFCMYKCRVCAAAAPNLLIIMYFLCGRLSAYRLFEFAIYISYSTSHISSSFLNNDQLLQFKSHFYLNLCKV